MKSQGTSITENGYKQFSSIYRQVAKCRKHFIKQVSLLEHIFDLLGIPPRSKVLDAACGTGDVAGILCRKGLEIFASDGSADMLAQWKSYDQHVPHVCCDWSNLNKVFPEAGSFDVIYLLGNSVAHAPKEIIQTCLFKQAFERLKEQGLFLFDIRPWKKDSTGKISEAERLAGVERVLQKVELPDGLYWLIDKISYMPDRQIVEYLISKTNQTELTHLSTLKYFIFDWKEASEWLSNAGFQNIRIIKFPDWDYLVISAQRWS